MSHPFGSGLATVVRVYQDSARGHPNQLVKREVCVTGPFPTTVRNGKNTQKFPLPD